MLTNAHGIIHILNTSSSFIDDYNKCTWINMMKKKFKPLSNFKIFKEIIDKEFGGESKVYKMTMVANSYFKLAIRNSTIVYSNTILSKIIFLQRRIKLFLTRL